MKTSTAIFLGILAVSIMLLSGCERVQYPRITVCGEITEMIPSGYNNAYIIVNNISYLILDISTIKLNIPARLILERHQFIVVGREGGYYYELIDICYI